MGRMLVFVVGLIAGAVLAQLLSRTPQGGRVVAAVNGTTDEFVRAVSESYRARRSEGT